MAGAIMLNPSAGCGCAPPPPDNCGSCCVSCAPCPIPLAQLTLNWTNGLPSGTFPPPFNTAGSAPLYYNGSGGWYTGCLGTSPNQVGFSAVCTIGNMGISYIGFGANCGAQVPIASWDYSSSPWSGNVCNPLYIPFAMSGGVGLWISGPAYGAHTCCRQFIVSGCLNPASGVTVSVYDHAGGTLLAQGKTDSNGKAWLVWPCPAYGNHYVTAQGTNPRYGMYAATAVIDSTTTPIFIQLPAASGYMCLQLYSGGATITCPDPIKQTLIFTGAGGSCTLYYIPSSGGAGQFQGCYAPTTPNVITSYNANCTTNVSASAPCPVQITFGGEAGTGNTLITAQWGQQVYGLGALYCYNVGMSCNPDGSLHVGYTGPCGIMGLAEVGDSQIPTCAPFSFSGSFPAYAGGVGGTPCPVGGPYTITEA